MPVYDCPECGAQLKIGAAVAPGKKIRCPKCEEVFAPSPAKAAKPAGKGAAKPETTPQDRNAALLEAGGYGVAHDPDEKKAGQETVFQPLRDRFVRSKRGPALVQVVKPSTILLACGVLTCVMAIAGGLYSVWPMIFKVEEVQPEDKMAKWKPPAANSGRRFKELSDDDRNERFIYLGAFVFQFLWGCVVCVGASNMHTLSGYPLAMTGSIMAIVGAGVPAGLALLQYILKENDAMWYPAAAALLLIPGAIICPWCVSVLRKQEVIDGFEEEKPEDF